MEEKFPSVSRREFLLATAATALLPAFLRNSSYAAALPADGVLNHACIGVGGMGYNDLSNFVQHSKVKIIAICDVDANNLKKASELVPGARTYSDWRELLEKEKDNIHSVNVAIPDHNHFAVAYSAIKAGKHVYCQKPLCHDVAEVRVLTNAAIKAGVHTQLGTQIASTSCDRTAVQLIKDGVIGKVKHAYLCSNRPGAQKYRLSGPRPDAVTPVPESLNWDLWLGTAPQRPYAPGIYHPGLWRAWQDFGTGWSGDIGCHIFDAVWKGLGLKAPKSVVAEVDESWKNSAVRRGDTWPQGNHITWKFPGNSMTASDELTLEWFDGEFYPPKEVRELFSLENYPAESAMLIGTEGAILIPHGGEAPYLLPQSKFASLKYKKFESRNHYHHFADACLGGEKTESFFAQSGPMTEAILLGTVAQRVPGELLEWNSAKLKFNNSKTAGKFLSRVYRKGFEIKGVF